MDTLNFVIDILKEYFEDLEDYESVISSYDSINMSDSTTLTWRFVQWGWDRL